MKEAKGVTKRQQTATEDPQKAQTEKALCTIYSNSAPTYGSFSSPYSPLFFLPIPYPPPISDQIIKGALPRTTKQHDGPPDIQNHNPGHTYFATPRPAMSRRATPLLRLPTPRCITLTNAPPRTTRLRSRVSWRRACEFDAMTSRCLPCGGFQSI